MYLVAEEDQACFEASSNMNFAQVISQNVFYELDSPVTNTDFYMEDHEIRKHKKQSKSQVHPKAPHLFDCLTESLLRFL